MSHEIETMAYSGEKPWHGLGVNVSSNQSPAQMLKKSGLDWKVEKQRLKTEGGVWLPDTFAVVRDSDNKPLSTCSKNYIPVQNDDAMDFFSKFVKAGKMTMETAGSLAGGQRIWGLARMKGGDFRLPGGDDVEGYLLLSNSHKPGKAFTIMFTPIRVVCNNTLTMALKGTSKINVGDKIINGLFRMSHKRKFDEITKEEAASILGLTDSAALSFKEQAKLLASKRATDKQVDKFFAELYQPKLMIESVIDAEQFNPTIRKLKQIMNEQPGAEMSEGSWWQALNAVTFFIDHVKGKEGESRLNTAWFGPQGAGKKSKALELAIKMAQQSRKL